MLRPLLLGVTIIFLATGLPYLGNFGRFDDFSYGIYILHFPVLQWLVWKGWFREPPLTTLLIACGVVLLGAIASWRFLERPFLLRTSHYVTASRSPS